MPRVPTYDTPQVEARALPGYRESSVASPALFGADAERQMGAAKGMLNAGMGIANAAAVVQDRENADILFRAETVAKDRYLIYEQDVRANRVGIASWRVTQDTEKWFTDLEKEIGGTLQNDVQRRLFGQTITKLRLMAKDSIGRFEETERKRSTEEAAQSSIVGSINLAAANAAEWYARPPVPVAQPAGEATAEIGPDGSPVTTANAPVEVTATRDPILGIKSDILKRVQLLSNLNKWSPERKAAEEGKHLTNLHKQVIQSLAVKTPGKAKDYYEANKEEINGADRDGVEKALKEGTLREVAQSFADEVETRGLGMAEALTEARRKYSGDEEAAAVQEVKSRFADAQSALRLGQQQAADKAWKTITAGGGRRSIPLDVWNSMAGEEQRQVLDYLDAKSRRAQAEANRDSKAGLDDLENLDKVERMIEQGDITDRAGLARYEPYFSKQTLRTLSTKIDKRGVVSPTDIRREFEERKGAKVNVAKMSETERAEWMAFQDYILSNVKETKRPEDVNQWADRWFLKGYGKEDTFLRNDPDTYGEARTKGRKDFVIRTPEAAQAGADQALSILERQGVVMPKDRRLARDEFYTNHVLEAERWAGAHGIQSSPQLAAAYALLKQNKKPITPANLDYVIKQFK